MKLTKKFRKETTRALLDTIKVGAWFGDKEVEAFNTLTGFEYKKYKKILAPDDIRQNGVGVPVRNVWVGDVKEMRSWLKQIDDPEHLKRKEWNPRQAMRNAIKSEMIQQAKFLGNHCEHCNSQTNLSVDHKDIPFSVIADTFLEVHPDIETGTPPGEMGHFFMDKDLEQKFLDIHNAIATYQLLCRSCNSKKGNRK
jgi:5-methylcytosine-specific restriction endonuclease McrA